MSLKAYFLGGLVLLAPAAVPTHGESQASIDILKIMSNEESRCSGISKLDPSELACLNEWLESYTMDVVRYIQSVSGGEYLGTGSGHWIKSVSNQGRIVTLEDGSVWEIHSFDRLNTALWLPITEITVIPDDEGYGGYIYLLINTDDGETASAKYLGQ